MSGTGLAPAALGAPSETAPDLAARGRVLLASRRFRSLLEIAALVAAYYAAAQIGYAFEFAGPVASIIWLPVGVAIAFLYLGGVRLWPGVVIGDLLVNDYSALPLGSAVAQTLGNLLEVLLAALLMRRLIRAGSPLGSVSNLTRTLVAIAAGAAVSATVGVLSLRLGGVLTTAAAPTVWRTWWLGDWSGALVIIPLAIAWVRPPRHPWTGRRLLGITVLVGATAGLSLLAIDMHRPLAYLVFPGLIWAALRFGPQGATLAIAVVSGVAVWATTHFEGPFAFHSITRSVFSAQLYVAVAALSTLYLAAVSAEREELALRLRRSRERLVEVADAERRRLEHNLHDGAQQRLTGLAVRLGIAAERAREDPGVAVPMIEDAQSELFVAIDELRELARGIHPTALTRYGLSKAIESIAEQAPVAIDLVELPSRRVDLQAEATAYYLFAEAITNAQRHAQASRIRARVTVHRGTLEMEIVDDGIGGATEGAGHGLEGLRDRVEAIGGVFVVDSVRGRGTRIAAAIPAREPGPERGQVERRPAGAPGRLSAKQIGRQAD
jgi:signal transduction histidine kinase